jgi:hypothetical protein
MVGGGRGETLLSSLDKDDGRLICIVPRIDDVEEVSNVNIIEELF